MYQNRLYKLQQDLKNPLLIKKKENLLYLTGRVFMSGYLLVNPSQPPLLKRGGVFAVPPSFQKRGLGGVIFLGDGLEQPPKIHSDILKNIGMYLGRYRVLEIEDVFSFAEYRYLRTKIQNSRIKIKHRRSPVDYQRMIKEPKEIALIRKSMQIVERVFGEVRTQLRRRGGSRTAPTERELAQFIQKRGLQLGAQDVSFPPIVASGANAAIPHHVPSSKKLKPGESIIIDFGFKYKNYCSDFTRTVFLKRVPSKLEKAYNQVEKAYNESMRYIEDGLLGFPQKTVLWGGMVYQKAVDVLAEKKLDKYFIHSLGHGTGLEIHELPNLSPKSKDILREGMVISIEPGVYIPNSGGIRIEDLVYLKGGAVKKFINVSTYLKSNII